MSRRYHETRYGIGVFWWVWYTFAMSISASLQPYLKETVRQWLGLTRSDSAHVPEMPDRLARRFLRLEEQENPHRDQWGNWEHSFSESYHQGKLWSPEINLWVSEQRTRLKKNGVPLAPLWPNDRPYAVCLTHDVDRLSREQSMPQRVRAFKKLFVAGDFKDLPLSDRLFHLMGLAGGLLKPAHKPSLDKSIGSAVELERQHGASSSFFFTVWPLLKPSIYDCVYETKDEVSFEAESLSVGKLMKKLSDTGFDVGLHGSYHSSADAEMLSAQKQVLEDTGIPAVTTTRQHYLRWDRKKTANAQSQAGFLVDTTMGYNRNVGYRHGVALPFHHYDAESGKALPLLELPLTAMDGALFDRTALELDLSGAKAVLGHLLESIADTSGVATLLFHPESLQRGEALDLYAWALERCAKEGAWLTSAKAIGEWWQKRSEALNQ